MQAAANAHDTDRFMSAFLRTSELVFAVNGEVIHGWDALREQQRKWWNDGKSDAVYSEQGASEFQRLDGRTVITTSRFRSKRSAADGSAKEGAFAVSYVWKKLPQGWTIVYGHESWAR
ncbi:MAG TPA: nuclear transport factor 2 family protein [Rudaea sp.]|nr:nuclear transport factor 2 family protein [Rudaea sp.]